jgi:hypothetical protein
MIYTHVLNRGGLGVRSPFDALQGSARQNDDVCPVAMTEGNQCDMSRCGPKKSG